jgi:hypothetical protein
MCDYNQPKPIKYPYSNLKTSLYNYVRVVEEFISYMYGDIRFRVIPFQGNIGIIIYDVNPHPFYSPYNFDPYYRVIISEKEIIDISEYDFFQSFYSYIPDIVPYLIFKLHPHYEYGLMDYKINDDGSFSEFNLKEMFFKEESRKAYYRQARMFNERERFFEW